MPLSRDELRQAENVLGRGLTAEEQAMLEALWSEHCSYKSTKMLLRKLPSSAPWVVVGPGRDAAAIKLFEDVVLVARIESHNHPSALDPYNGAATGVGGIIRDVLSLGARPVLLLDALYLGDPGDSHDKWLAKGIVRGISDYGNRVGVPTAGGHTWFSKSYSRQPLVNVACVGIASPQTLVEGGVEPGDVIIIAGNTTGRDGLLGSSFASKPLQGDEDLAAVQVGNPFLEKLLVDAVSEAASERLLRHVKDLGGGGLATALIETAAQSGVGFTVHLDRLHLREQGLSPTEILVSESQERMLLVPRRGAAGKLLRLLDKYGVEYSVIGYFEHSRVARFMYRGVTVAEIPLELASPPVQPRRASPPPPPQPLPKINAGIKETLESIIATPRAGSKAWIYESYDWGVGGRTVGAPGFYDAAVIWLRDGSRRGFAAALAGNPRYTRLDPFRGAALSLAEAYRKVAAAGAEPMAVLDNVNSGNPEKPEQHGYTAAMLEGLAWMARGLGVPVVGGNVSLYNEDKDGRMVDPVTTVMVIGRIDDVSRALPSVFLGCGLLLVAGETRPNLGGSEAAEQVLGYPAGRPPEPKPGAEKRVARLVRSLASRGLLCSAKSIGLGGLLTAAAKAALLGGHGASIDLRRVCPRCSGFEAAFSETPARVLLEATPDALDKVMSHARRLGVHVEKIGYTFGKQVLEISDEGSSITIDLENLRVLYDTASDRMRG